MTTYENVQNTLRHIPKRWLITGVAGFIGSNLLETLLKLDQQVTGLDNFATGHQRNLDEVQRLVSPEQWSRFRFIKGDICNLSDCQASIASDGKSVDYVLHEAALGSVPRSLADPIATNRANVDGFVNMLVAARDAEVQRFVYAASSSTYGDHPGLPKVEDTIGKPLSPYAVTKYVNELYAGVFGRCYQLKCIGLRYFNVFGKRQDPNGAYAAVIPKWTYSIINGDSVTINGDGETSRDFCYVENVVQANILAAAAINPNAIGKTYNIAYGERTTLVQLFQLLRSFVAEKNPLAANCEPIFVAERPGDVRHSLAQIDLARQLLGYEPTHSVKTGLREACAWYADHNF